MRILYGILGVALLGYVALVALLFSQQRRLLYHPSVERVSAQEAGIVGFEDVELTTPDGERLVGWWKPPEPGRAVIVYFHGNAGSLLNRRDRSRLLARDGRGLLIVSYRGYSGSTGSPSEEGLKRDGETVLAYLSSYAPGRIVLYGESLGTGVATWLASRNTVGGLILDSPYPSLPDVARASFWFAPVDLLMRDRFRSIDVVGKVAAPILMLHGARDGLIPIALGERLFAAAPEPKRFVRLPEAGHVDILERGGIAEAETFLSEVETRFRQSLPAEAATKEGAARR